MKKNRFIRGWIRVMLGEITPMEIAHRSMDDNKQRSDCCHMKRARFDPRFTADDISDKRWKNNRITNEAHRQIRRQRHTRHRKRNVMNAQKKYI